MRTLHLNLKKKFFDMILSGEKKEEYREISLYWAKRLCNGFNDPDRAFRIEHLTRDASRLAKYFDQIIFRNGYSKNAPEITIEFKGIEIGTARPEWSDNWQGTVFIIKLGEIIETKNI